MNPDFTEFYSKWGVRLPYPPRILADGTCNRITTRGLESAKEASRSGASLGTSLHQSHTVNGGSQFWKGLDFQIPADGGFSVMYKLDLGPGILWLVYAKEFLNGEREEGWIRNLGRKGCNVTAMFFVVLGIPKVSMMVSLSQGSCHYFIVFLLALMMTLSTVYFFKGITLKDKSFLTPIISKFFWFYWVRLWQTLCNISWFMGYLGKH